MCGSVTPKSIQKFLVHLIVKWTELFQFLNS